MRIARTLAAPALVAAVAIASGAWLAHGDAGVGGYGSGARLFAEVMQRVSRDYVEPRSESQLYGLAVDGMLQGLGDPHTAYLRPDDLAQLRAQASGEFGGLGIAVGRREGWITAMSVLPGTPAERAGLRMGDRIVAVDGGSTKGWTETEAVKNLRGPSGSAVRLRVVSLAGGAQREVSVVRGPIRLQAVPYAFLLAPGVGYVSLSVFNANSTRELTAAIERLRAQGMRGLVLDLRGNPGGLLDQGVAVADLFLPTGRKIVETRSRDPREEGTFIARTPQSYPGLRIVALVDEYSASAAEIVAGALQDHDRALVLGEPTYGKGSVQGLFPTSGGGALKLTTAKWYTPSGRSIQKKYVVAQSGAEAALVPAGGTPAAEPRPVDSAAPTPFRTDAGRVVYGGGGIVPDILLQTDSASATEKAFFRAVGTEVTRLDDVLFRFAVEYARTHADLARGFVISSEMRAELARRLREAGIRISDAEIESVRRLIDRRLVRDIARARWGAGAGGERDLAADRAVQAALRLLRAAPTQPALLRMAPR